jgi:putative membrane protein
MTVRWLLAAFHLLALGIGLGAVVARAMALRGRLDEPSLRRVFLADMLWGLAALLWISTGLVRAFAGFEKGTAYYLGNHWFLAKMGLLVFVLLLEGLPMITLLHWRAAARMQVPLDKGRALVMSRISIVQAVLVVAMVFAATAMTRGLGN